MGKIHTVILLGYGKGVRMPAIWHASEHIDLTDECSIIALTIEVVLV